MISAKSWKGHMVWLDELGPIKTTTLPPHSQRPCRIPTLSMLFINCFINITIRREDRLNHALKRTRFHSNEIQNNSLLCKKHYCYINSDNVI